MEKSRLGNFLQYGKGIGKKMLARLLFIWLFLISSGVFASGEVMFIHTDGLGSPVARSDKNGNLISGSRTRYEPYGATAAGATPTIGFTGHVNDAATGLIYMQQRYYDPYAGRFLSTDPVLTDANTGSSFNRYVYANNNPYKYVDPAGRFAIAGGGAIGTGIVLIAMHQYSNNPQFRATTNRAFNAVVSAFTPSATTTGTKLNSGNNSSAGASASASAGGAASPQIDPKDVAGKPAADIEKLAGELGLQPKGPDPKGGRGAYVDPVTGEQRILIHPGGANGGHTHVNDPSGQRLDIDGKPVPAESPDAHLPLGRN